MLYGVGEREGGGVGGGGWGRWRGRVGSRRRAKASIRPQTAMLCLQ